VSGRWEILWASPRLIAIGIEGYINDFSTFGDL